jgi:hypothetical protein
MKDKKTYIYGLIDLSNPNNVRYVGKSDNPENRLKRHIQITKYNYKNNKNLTHKDRWLSKIKYNVGYVILEECNLNNWQDVEMKYISKYQNLTNTSSGGMGGSGLIYKLTYDEVKNWVKINTSIVSKSKWYEFIKYNELPKFIPKNPREVYLKKGWISWGDFLSTGRMWDNNIVYVDYEESKQIIKKLNIQTGLEYRNFAKNNLIPPNVPNRPERYYKKRGWVSWGDFLSTGRIANQLKKTPI